MTFARLPVVRTLAVALLVTALAPRGACADVPPLLVPAHGDSGSVDAPAAPLIIPGRRSLADSLAKTPRQRADEKYALAHALARDGHPAAAISAYSSALKIDPTLPEAHQRIGELYETVGQHKAAALQFAAELERHPDNTEAGRALGLALAQMGDSTRAINQLELLTRRDPHDGATWRALGFAYGTAHRPQASIRAFQRAIALDPRDAAAWRDLGVVQGSQGQATQARASFTHATQLDPHDSGALLDLGNLETREQHPDAALAAYARAEQADSLNSLAYRGQIETLLGLGREADAGGVYRRWLRVQPDDAATRMQAMMLFDHLGRLDIALELARDGVRREPRSSTAHFTLGMAHQANRQPREALGELRTADQLAKDPKEHERIEAAIRNARAAAPDSLRAFYAADSAAHERPPQPAPALPGGLR